MFYTFNQNNSGGSFHTDANRGIAEYVAIEADSAEQANAIAPEKGLYFDGVYYGMDCECCGDRWYAASKFDGYEYPAVYGEPVEEYIKSTIGWVPKSEPTVSVHYADGTIKNYY